MKSIHELTIDLNNKCNLRCRHCSNPYFPAKPEIRVRDACKIISEFAELGGFQVNFSGGEPLLYEGLIELLQHCSKLGIQSTIYTTGFACHSKCSDKEAKAPSAF